MKLLYIAMMVPFIAAIIYNAISDKETRAIIGVLMIIGMFIMGIGGLIDS